MLAPLAASPAALALLVSSPAVRSARRLACRSLRSPLACLLAAPSACSSLRSPSLARACWFCSPSRPPRLLLHFLHGRQIRSDLPNPLAVLFLPLFILDRATLRCVVASEIPTCHLGLWSKLWTPACVDYSDNFLNAGVAGDTIVGINALSSVLCVEVAASQSPSTTGLRLPRPEVPPERHPNAS